MVEPQRFCAADPEGLDEDVRMGQQRDELVAVGRRLDIQDHALLASIPGKPG
jgi:hypothetical protein